jgi:hypothetical protein
MFGSKIPRSIHVSTWVITWYNFKNLCGYRINSHRRRMRVPVDKLFKKICDIFLQGCYSPLVPGHTANVNLSGKNKSQVRIDLEICKKTRKACFHTGRQIFKSLKKFFFHKFFSFGLRI